MVKLTQHFQDKHLQISQTVQNSSVFFGSEEEVKVLIELALERWNELHIIKGRTKAYFLQFPYKIGQRNSRPSATIKVLTRRNIFVTAYVVTQPEIKYYRRFEAIKIFYQPY
jgi:hypothetical protein